MTVVYGLNNFGAAMLVVTLGSGAMTVDGSADVEIG